MNQNSTQTINLKPYVIQFAVFYALATLFIAALSWIIDYFFQIDLPASAVTITSLFTAASIVAMRFVGKHQRLFSKSERQYLSWTSLLMSWLVSILFFLMLSIGFYVYAGISFFDALLPNFSFDIVMGMILLLAMSLVSVLYYFSLYWAYGFMAKNQLVALEKKKIK